MGTMSKEQAKDQLIEVLMNQVVDLSMMSKIELGDDVIEKIQELKKIINGQFKYEAREKGLVLQEGVLKRFKKEKGL